MSRIHIAVNSVAVEDEVPARLTLADFLRERCHVTGTHLGCEHGVCGACTILLDGEPARACLVLAIACDGRAVQTIEGFKDDAAMAALRASFHRRHALQCGFCTPGMLITAHDLIRRGKAGGEREIPDGHSGNISRSTGNNNIVAAIAEAAAQLGTSHNGA